MVMHSEWTNENILNPKWEEIYQGYTTL